MSSGSAGPLAFLIVLLLIIATVLLIRNMNARLRRLPLTFPEPGEPASPPDGPSDESASGPTSDA